MGQTHGRIQDRYQLHRTGNITLTYEIGTLDAKKAFVLCEDAKIRSKVLSGDELDLFIGEVEKAGGKDGEFRDKDLGAWVKDGPAKLDAYREEQAAILAAEKAAEAEAAKAEPEA